MARAALRKLVLVMAATVVIFSICRIVSSDHPPRLNLVVRYCNNDNYNLGDPFGLRVLYVLSDLVSTTSDMKEYEYRNRSPYPNSAVYGYARCSKDLKRGECYDCLLSALIDMLKACPNSQGSHLIFLDCELRYEKYEIA